MVNRRNSGPFSNIERLDPTKAMGLREGFEIASKVVAYSGYKANERPMVFFLDRKPIRIREILKQWKDPECDCFRILGEDNNQYELKWDRSRDQWFIHKRPPKKRHWLK